MLGNDVVDLTLDCEKHLNHRFIKRILTLKEQQQLQLAHDKNLFLWSLWSIKEASYKACQKLNHLLLFSPSQLELNDSSLKKLTEHHPQTAFFGTLKHQSTELQLKLTWYAEHSEHSPTMKYTAVHATALQGTDPKSLADVQVEISKMNQPSNYKNQSLAVRKLATKLLESNAITASIQRPPITIKDYSKPGPPILVSDQQTTLPHEISLSHDNDWLAAVLLIK
ncbi:4'-phosphopantetheinyl transferase superfamily protein [Marinicella litoralis]|uniref:Phosphopantetheine--protein transferase-like protein n=1 Tax=Marinicella litoralis TaxID=644220 RepID=A0A4R6Y0V0_9GAMM|nr:4'-phosphopantetheinyl transferase superfamily protein [Marinicella litoralis]TDR22558.1 phosphopantetheine--protein transferase-like protein [Marinicella litoralis]